MRFLWRITLLALALFTTRGATFSESFAVEPSAWRAHNSSAFAWDPGAENLRVTWDSREPNAFFYYPLPWTLTRAETFMVELTLRLDDLQLAIDPTKTYTFPLCFGFLNLAQATRPDYFRGSGIHAVYGPRSVVEFSYFPDAGLDPTVGPIVASTNNQITFAHTHPLELAVGETYRITLQFTAQTLRTTILRNGESIGAIAPVAANRGDFNIDAFSIHSYNHGQQSPPQFAGSLLAHGIVDDVVITCPDPPVGRLSITSQAITFQGKAGWRYELQRTTDFSAWEAAGSQTGIEGEMSFPASQGFYRVAAFRE